MRQGPGTPFNRMNPRMMGSGFRQGPRQFGMGPQHSFGSPQFRMNSRMGMGMGQPAKQGGFLANLFGKGSGAGANLGHTANTATRASGGGLLQTLTNPNSINGFLNNTQQVLKTAQQIGPMIQQYGPLVKNLPAMWKLYRGFKDLPDQEEDSVEENDHHATKKTVKTEKETVHTDEHDKQTVSDSKETKPNVRKGVSTPKLFF